MNYGGIIIAGKSTNKLITNQDCFYIVILLAITLGIGVYITTTTALISKDGVFYIEQAQQLANKPIETIKVHPPGHPFLISSAYKLTSFFVDDTSNQTWLYSAQGVTLLCRLLAIIPLYLIGKLLVGNKNSFWGLMILSILPDSAAFGSDALAEWPQLLFLAIGFLLLLLGAQYHKSWLFGWVGITAGLGYLIRSEGCQLVLFGGIWLIFNLISIQGKMKRTKAASALFLLLVGFAVIAIPYIRFTGYVFPDQSMLKLPAFLSFNNDSSSNLTMNTNMCLAGLPIKLVLGNETLITNMCETLRYYFVPALLIGCYFFFRKQPKKTEQIFFVAAFIIFNIVMLTWQSNRFLSRRHTLAMVVLTIFYVPIGLQVIAGWLNKKYIKTNVNMQKSNQIWFLILLIIGIIICLPKLLKPIRIDKLGYLEVAKWLKENTSSEDVIAAPDRRITFYADRKGLIYEGVIPEDAKYVVRMIKGEGEKLKTSLTGQEKYSVWANERKKKKKIVVYEMF